MNRGDEVVRWLRERGGDAAFARTRSGGRSFLAQGDVAPFTIGIFSALVKAGRAEYSRDGQGRITRIRLVAVPTVATCTLCERGVIPMVSSCTATDCPHRQEIAA